MSSETGNGSPRLGGQGLGEDGNKENKPKQKLEERKSAPQANASLAKPQNRVDDRNFRSHYYEKVGFRGMDERKTLEIILKDDPINFEKCVNFTLRCTIPAAERLFVWKLLLGEEPAYPNNRKEYTRWKERTYRDCKRLLKSSSRIEDSWPLAKTLTIMWLLFDAKLNLEFQSQLNEWYSQNFMAIAESMLVITSSNEMEAFWLAKGLAGIINKHSEIVFSELIQSYHRYLSSGQNTNKLYSHFEKIGLNEEIPLRSWFGRGFAGVLRESALEKLWDKLSCGAMMLMVFVAVALVEVKKMQLTGCQTAKEAIRCLASSSEESDEMIVQKGIELWVQEGSCLLPPTNFPIIINQKKDLHQIMPSGRPPFLDNPSLPLVGRIKIASVIIEEENVQQ